MTPVRLQLLGQAVLTGAVALRADLSGWTFATLVVAAAAVFVATALQQTPSWRGYVLAFQIGSIGYGVAALVAGHAVPGTLAAVASLLWLRGPAAADAFAGAPSYPVLDLPFPEPEPVASAPAADAPAVLQQTQAPEPPPEPEPQPVAVVQVIAPRRPVMDVLPRR